MSTEFVSGFKFAEGDTIKGYKILKAFDPGAFAFAGKAKATNGRTVFFKKYKRPGAAAKWYDAFVAYQTELKRCIQSNEAAKKLCYEFIEFFELKKSGGAVPLRAFYQVFEWVEGGTDLRGVVDRLRSEPNVFDWKQRVVFARVMMAGIDAIHKAGIVHTDLKPENFYLVPADTPSKYALRVIDMDFSLIDGRQAPWHGYGEGYVGTDGYMSPEHLSNQVPQKASDVFTCGLILGELLGGSHPSGDNMDAYSERAKSGRLRSITPQRPIQEAPDGEFVSYVINAAMRPEASRRPTAEEVLRALSGQLSEFDGKRPKTTVATPIPAPKPDRVSPAPTASPRASPSRPATVTPIPAVPTPLPIPSTAPAELEITGSTGQRLAVNLAAKFGRAHFKSWNPDCEKYMSSEQFRLFKDTGGKWMIEHCAGATNATTANGTPLTSPIPVISGMTIALGKTGKCPLTLCLD